MNTTSQSSLDPRAKRWGIAIKYLALLGVGFVVAPYVWIALGGLLGLILAGAIMFGTWLMLPVVEAAGQNLRLKLIKGEAARNPVLTLQNDLRQKTVALDDRKTAIQKLDGQIRTFGDKVDAIRSKYGPQDTAYLKLAGNLVDLKRVLVHRGEKWKEAHEQLKRYAEEIDRAQMIWDAGQAAAAAQESSGLSEEEFYAKLRSETAFDAISASYNEALASLDTSLLESEAEKSVVSVTPAQTALPAPDDRNVIDATVLQPAKVRTAR